MTEEVQAHQQWTEPGKALARCPHALQALDTGVWREGKFPMGKEESLHRGHKGVRSWRISRSSLGRNKAKDIHADGTNVNKVWKWTHRLSWYSWRGTLGVSKNRPESLYFIQWHQDFSSREVRWSIFIIHVKYPFSQLINPPRGIEWS